MSDSNPPAFIPPPHGATNGGHPGPYDPFPQPRRENPWQPWPSYHPAPWPPTPASAPAAAWGQSPWPAPTPSASWGPSSPPASYPLPPTPAAYSPWNPPSAPQSTPWPSANPPALYDSPSQPITTGWFGAGPTGIASGTGYPEAGWPSRPSTPHRGSKSRSNSMKRASSSQNASPKRGTTQLQRSTSWGHLENWGAYDPQAAATYGGSAPGPSYGFGYPNTPAYMQGDFFSERDLARRPRDWRPDYNPRPGIGAYISRVGKTRSDVRDFTDIIKRKLHPLLLHESTDHPPIYFNLQETPFHTSSIEFCNLSRPHNSIDFAQLAVQPTSAFMRLFHPKFPWYIDVHQVHPNGITVLDVLSQMHAQLQTPIHGRHFYNEELSDTERAAITRTFTERCRGDPALVSRGVIQLDFLGPKFIFEGLVRGPKGLWEMRLTKDDL